MGEVYRATDSNLNRAVAIPLRLAKTPSFPGSHRRIDDAAHRRKAGPYEILDRVGAGGMGEVYRARDTRLQRTVAIKLIRSEHAGDPEFRDRFQREARAISALNHPHICSLYDIGEHQGIDYLVMEYVEVRRSPKN